jgi:hypothetical protein
MRSRIPDNSMIRVSFFSCYGILGNSVECIINITRSSDAGGHHDVVFHANNLASGVYFYRLEAGSSPSVKK